MKGKTHRKLVGTIRSEINITPLVDVVLVLLIIFMVIIPLMSRGRNVPIPKSKFFSERPDVQQPVLALTFENDLYLDSEKIGSMEPGAREKTLEKAATMVQRIWDLPNKKDAAGKVYVKVDGKVPYGKVYPLIMAVNQQMNVTAIDLATAKVAEE
jgi:biopolymer transport protein ExbD